MSIERPRVSSLGLAALQMSVVIVCLLQVFTSAQSADSDKAVMQQLRKSLQIPPAVKWPDDKEPCSWQYVTCDYSGRVTRIQLGNQGLSGSLPLSINNLTKLEVLEFMSNNLTGALPSLNGLSSLQRLYLHNNGFDSIPKDFFKGLSSLQEVFLDYNPFSSWTIPDELQGALSLMKFSANSANVIGKIPDFFNSSTFPSLTHLHLSNNQLQGSLPSGFSSLGLQSLWLNGQKDQGGARILSGTIEFLQNMTQLVQIWFNMNSFTGPIPDLSGLSSLQDLNLRDNTLSGPVPPSLTKLTSLKVVNLTNNALQGPTPKFPASVAADMLPGQNSFCTPNPGVDCNTRVNALISVLEPFGYPFDLASHWKGNDPCDNWDGITCLNGNITTISFSNRKLSGTISSSFASLTSVQTLYLSKNNITGPVPDALTKMPNLKTLDLSDNRLCGPLPTFKSNTSVNVGNNADINKLCKGPSGGSGAGGSGAGGSGVGGKDSKKGKVVGAVIGSICVLLGACLLLFCFVKRQWRYGKLNQSKSKVIHPNHLDSNDAVKITIAGHGVNGNVASEGYSQGSSGPTDVHVIETNNMVISIQVLRSVTNNFSEDNVLGKGGFGTVYRGELPDGTKIAVKRMNSAVLGDTGLAEFKSEIGVLSKVRHRHLVSLLGFCLDGNEKILVFEYLPRGDLSMHLFSWKEEGLKPLEWKQRLTIALDVARGVEYLHGLAHQSFIHRDLKPSNILLGDDMRAKVADFGLVRLAPNDGKASIQTKLAGTFGYLAPEYAVLGRVTTKVDVFSFGVILMEMITGRKALIESQSEDSVHLVAWFKMMCANKDTFERAIDPAIEQDRETLASINTVSELAGHCCAREPSQRPDMGHVVNVLSSLTHIWKPAAENSEDDLFAIDLHMTLPEALKKWQMLENSIDSSSSTFIRSGENSQASIPTVSFAASFASKEGR